MKQFRPRMDTYNSGALYVCRPISGKSSFSAKKNTVTYADLERIEKLDYEEKAKRLEDMDFAQRDDRTLSLKVRTRYLSRCADTSYQVLIGDRLYGIIKIDPDKAAGEMYLYLEEIRRLK